MENIFVDIAASLRQALQGSMSTGAVEALIDLLGVVGALVFTLLNVLLLVWVERKASAMIQQRMGPNRLGPKGLFQSIADAIKLLTKEEITPRAVDKWVFRLAGALIFVPPILSFAIIPFGKDMIINDLNIGIFWSLSVASLGTVIMLMAGWGSNNKYSLVGGMRAVAQMISYEIPLVFSLLGVVMLTGSMQMSKIVEAQNNVWFIVPQFLAFLIYFVAGTAEINRAPFDMPEAEQELVAGVFTEYSGMRWALFFLAEYANMVIISSIAVTLFLGGWHAPFGLTFIPSWAWYVIKLWFMIMLFMWTRWTLPRLRVDHLMHFGWKVLLPLSLANVVVTGVGIYVYRWMGW